MAYRPIQSISGNNDRTNTSYMVPLTTGTLGLPCLLCSGMLRTGFRWSLIRLCTNHVQWGACSLMLVEIGRWEPGLQAPIRLAYVQWSDDLSLDRRYSAVIGTDCRHWY
jgi:hypothetical protein